MLVCSSGDNVLTASARPSADSAPRAPACCWPLIAPNTSALSSAAMFSMASARCSVDRSPSAFSLSSTLIIASLAVCCVTGSLQSGAVAATHRAARQQQALCAWWCLLSAVGAPAAAAPAVVGAPTTLPSCTPTCSTRLSTHPQLLGPHSETSCISQHAFLQCFVRVLGLLIEALPSRSPAAPIVSAASSQRCTYLCRNWSCSSESSTSLSLSA